MSIDTSYQPALIRSIVENAKPTAICTKSQYCDLLTGTSVLPIMVENDWLHRVEEENSRFPSLKYPVPVSLDDTAFVPHTSRYIHPLGQQ
jgi:hypothetical protein